MKGICEADVKAVLGDADELVARELLRTEASIVELRRALQCVKGPFAANLKIVQALPARMRRLVDLLLVCLDGSRSAQRPCVDDSAQRRIDRAA